MYVIEQQRGVGCLVEPTLLLLKSLKNKCTLSALHCMVPSTLLSVFGSSGQFEKEMGNIEFIPKNGCSGIVPEYRIRKQPC